MLKQMALALRLADALPRMHKFAAAAGHGPRNPLAQRREQIPAASITRADDCR
jgi:hypothetical protein